MVLHGLRSTWASLCFFFLGGRCDELLFWSGTEKNRGSTISLCEACVFELLQLGRQSLISDFMVLRRENSDGPHHTWPIPIEGKLIFKVSTFWCEINEWKKKVLVLSSLEILHYLYWTIRPLKELVNGPPRPDWKNSVMDPTSSWLIIRSAYGPYSEYPFKRLYSLNCIAFIRSPLMLNGFI